MKKLPVIETALEPLGEIEDRSRAFAEYWFSLPKINLIPRRDAFHPEDLPKLLPNLVIHEILGPDIISLRLTGTAIERYYGGAVTGKNYLDFVADERRAIASKALHLICEQPSGMMVYLRSATESGRVQTRESIAFPMRGPDDVANLIYFCSGGARERDPIQDRPDRIKIMEVMERTYIDIGAGIPDFDG